jgi:hypothetical protein
MKHINIKNSFSRFSLSLLLATLYNTLKNNRSTMMQTAILATLLGSAAAFAPAPATKATTALSASEKSPAVPFLPYPENLKGYIGDDLGFDPLRISDYFPMDYLREAELKYVFCQL